MKVYVEHDHPAHLVRIYVVTDQQYLRDGEWMMYDAGTRPEPAFSLRRDVYEAIAREIQNEPLPQGSQGALAEALKDTREVRDRLLTIVERTVYEDVVPGA